MKTFCDDINFFSQVGCDGTIINSLEGMLLFGAVVLVFSFLCLYLYVKRSWFRNLINKIRGK